MSIYQKARCCECNKLYWTTRMEAIYTCDKCSTPKCPLCNDVNIIYIVAKTKECKTTKFLRCLSVTLIYCKCRITMDTNKLSFYSVEDR